MCDDLCAQVRKLREMEHITTTEGWKKHLEGICSSLLFKERPALELDPAWLRPHSEELHSHVLVLMFL